MQRLDARVGGYGMALLMFLAGGVAAAQCITPRGVYFDEFVPGGDNRDGTGFPRMFPQVSASFNGRPNVFAGVGKRVHVYDPTNPVKPTLLLDAALWTGGTVYLHNEYPLKHIAVRSGYPYGIASYSSEGWVLFRINWDANGKVTSLTNIAQFTFPSGSGSPDTWMWRAQLFQVGGRYYAVGRYLGPEGQRENFLSIADLGDGSGTPPLTRVAVLSSYPTNFQYFDTVQVGGSWYLYGFGTSFGHPQGALFIYNITNPSAPVLVNTISGATTPGVAFALDSGGIETELTAIVESGSRQRMYTIPFQPAGNRRVYAFDLANPTAPQPIGQVELTGTGYTAALASDGELVAVSLGKDPGKPRARYFAVGNDTFSLIGDGPLWLASEPSYDFELTTDVTIALVGTQYRVMRGSKIRAYWDTVEASCLSTTPNPGVSITRDTTRGTPSCTGGTAIERRGFPGDTFTIGNTSSGTYTFVKTEVLREGVPVAVFTNPAASWSWTSPGNQTGEFEVKITIQDSGGTQYTASKKLYLCENPQGLVKVTAVNGTPCTSCSWLQGQTLTLSLADSEGWPDFPASTWTLEFRPPSGNWEPLSPPPNGQTATLPLASLGDYRVTAIVAYPFGYQSTTPALVLHSGQVTGVLKLFQGSEVSRGGTVLANTGLELRWEGALAQSQTASCAWAILDSAQVVIWSASGPCAPPASQNHPGLGATGSYTARLQVTSSGGDSFLDEFPFAVSSCTPPGPASNPTPANGATGVPAGQQTLTWSGPTSGTGPFTYTVFGPLGPLAGCENLSTTSCTTNLSFPSGNFRWRVRVSNACGTHEPETFWEYTIGSACTQPSAPVPSSPAQGAQVAAGPVTFSWTPSSGTAPITYSVQVTAGGIGAGSCTTDSTSCSITLTAATTYTWTVTASNACGSAVSASRTFSIGSSCAPLTAPTPVSPAAGASVNAGAVQFTWTASSGTAPINYAVQLRAGPIGVGNCSSQTTTCSAALTTPGSYTWQVTATDPCGRQQSSSAIPFTVVSPCGPLSAPALVSPAAGAVVSGTAVTLQWSAPTQGQGPFTYDVFVDGVVRASGLSGLQTSVTGLTEGPHQWYVRAKDACGQAADSPSQTFTFALCAVSAPEPNFDWEPKGPDPYFPNQQRPFAGQEVTLTYTGLGGPPEFYRWYDFQQSPPKVVEGPNLTQVKHTWTAVSGTEYQDMNVRLKVRNCAGEPPDLLKQVRVYKDTRPVRAAFSTVGAVVAGSPATFRAETGPAYGDPTEFEWDFGDGKTLKGTSAQVQHTYACGRTYEVKLITRRGSTTSTAAVKPVAVGGKPCAPLALVVPDVAVNLQSTYALWQSRVRLFNPGLTPLTTSILARTRDNKMYTGNLTLAAGEAATLEDIILHLTPILPNNTVVTMWFTAQEGERLPLIGARTFTEPAGGGTYGQAVPVYYLWPPESVPTTFWVEGAEHDGVQSGFRTNLTVINPSPSNWGSGKGITLTLVTEGGQTYTQRLTGFGARQYNRYNPITELFGLAKEANLGAITLKVEVDAGVLALVGCSVNDNLTNDSFFLLAQPDVE